MHVSDEEFAEFKATIRKSVAGLGRTETTSRIAKDFGLFFLEFMEHSDRAIGVMIGVALEESSRELFESYLVAGLQTRRLLGRGHGLGSHSARIEMAFGLGLIPAWMRHDLLVLRDIRNECAHRGAAFFGKRPLSNLIGSLQAGALADAMIKSQPSFAEALSGAATARLIVAAGYVWLKLRVWSSVLETEFKCRPLPTLKASVFRKARDPKASRRVTR